MSPDTEDGFSPRTSSAADALTSSSSASPIPSSSSGQNPDGRTDGDGGRTPAGDEKEESSPRALVIGIGGEGCRIVHALSSCPGTSWIETAVVDTDSESLAETTAGKKIAASSDWVIRDGTGCGGDVIRGERALARERSRMASLLSGVSLLVVTGGLGGGTATGGMRTVASIVRSAKIPAVFLVSTPFSFEAYSRKKNADDCIAELLPVTDILLPLPNDLLFSMLPANTPAPAAFTKASEEIARTVAGICGLLRSRSIVGSDIASFMALLRGRKCTCGVGVGSASHKDGLDRCTIALERMLESPFLGGLAKLEASDAAIIVLSGGADLTLGEMKRTLEQISGMLPKGVNLLVGASTSPAADGRVQLTAISIKYEQKPESAPMRKDRKEWSSSKVAASSSGGAPASETAKGALEQGVLELQSYSKGIFANLPPTKYKEEDLDIPTFQRRNITIDKGGNGRS